MKHLRYFLFFAFAALTGTSLSAQRELTSLTLFQGQAITGISASGSFVHTELVYTPDRAQNRAVIRIDPELERYLRYSLTPERIVEVRLIVPDAERRRLESMYPDFSANRTARLTLYVSELKKVETSGSASIQGGDQAFRGNTIRVVARGSGNIEGLQVEAGQLEVTCSGSASVGLNARAERVSVVLSGSGFVALRGSADRAELNVSGSGLIRGNDFRIRQAAVRVVGSGDIRIHAEESISGSVAGSGTVRYAGQPARVSVNKMGSGSIRPL